MGLRIHYTEIHKERKRERKRQLETKKDKKTKDRETKRRRKKTKRKRQRIGKEYRHSIICSSVDLNHIFHWNAGQGVR